jgi:hypothetical protein
MFTHYLDKLSFYATQQETSDNLYDNYIETLTKYCDEQYLLGMSENKINLFEETSEFPVVSYYCSHCWKYSTNKSQLLIKSFV